MSARRKPELHLVGKAVEPSTEQLLRRHFAERDELAARMRVTLQSVEELTREGQAA